MKTPATTLLLFAAVVSGLGCVSSHMKQFMGRDVRHIAVEDGAPANVFDMPDGRRAFQYYWGGGAYTTPKVTTTQGQVQLVGDAAYYSEQKLESGGVTVRAKAASLPMSHDGMQPRRVGSSRTLPTRNEQYVRAGQRRTEADKVRAAQ